MPNPPRSSLVSEAGPRREVVAIHGELPPADAIHAGEHQSAFQASQARGPGKRRGDVRVEHIEAVVALGPGSFQFIADAQVEREPARNLPVVGEVSRPESALRGYAFEALGVSAAAEPKQQ